MTGVNGLKDLLDKFAALKESQAMWEFYSELPTAIKIVVWERFPEHHAALRAEERKQQQ
jgi:hypothetical protein